MQLAAATVRSPRVTQGALQRMLPSVDSHKFIRAWRVLARPTSLRNLSQIAQLLPNFRNIAFISIPCPGLSNSRAAESQQSGKHGSSWVYLINMDLTCARLVQYLFRRHGQKRPRAVAPPCSRFRLAVPSSRTAPVETFSAP